VTEPHRDKNDEPVADDELVAEERVTDDGPAHSLWVPTDGGISAVEEQAIHGGVSRRTMIRLGAVAAAGITLTAGRALAEPYLAQRGLLSGDGVFAAAATAITDLVYIEAFPTSPLILTPFQDELPIPKAMAPVPQSEFTNWAQPPGPGLGQQNSLGNETHQLWPTDSRVGYPDPIVYKIDLLVRTHSFTTSKVLPIDKNGRKTTSFDATERRTPPAPCGRCPTAPSTGSTAPSQGR
jgi:hypothetical protein